MFCSCRLSWYKVDTVRASLSSAHFARSGITKIVRKLTGVPLTYRSHTSGIVVIALIFKRRTIMCWTLCILLLIFWLHM